MACNRINPADTTWDAFEVDQIWAKILSVHYTKIIGVVFESIPRLTNFYHYIAISVYNTKSQVTYVGRSQADITTKPALN